MKIGVLASALMVGGLMLCGPAMASDLESGHKPEVPAEPGTQVVDPLTGLRGYMVMLKADTSRIGPEAAREMVIETLTQTVGVDRMRYVYEYALTGFAAWMTEKEAAMLQQRPDVLVVEPDLYLSTAESSSGFETNPNEPDPWNLRRISAPDGLAPAYDPCGADGTGVTAIVIDSGIDTDQTLFAGRIVEAISFMDSGPEDDGGHGTHVTGTIAGTGVGVAPACDIVSLKADAGLGGIYTSCIVAALNWVANPENASPPSVVNMSLGGPARGAASLTQFAAITYVSLFRGIPVVAAASNESYPARWAIPANIMFAITVGATNIFDQPAGFSNYGPEVDIWAPGVGILSANSEHPDGGLSFMSGTSMASPCAAGVVALFLQRHVTPQQIEEEPEFITSRAHIALARASVPAIVELDNPLLGVPGGTGTLGGSANQLLQVCDGSFGVICDEDIEWHGNTASIILGDGVTPIAADFECSRTIQHAAGPVELTINTISIDWFDAEPLIIEDVATGEIFFDSNEVFDGFEGEFWDVFYAAHDRTFVSSSRQGLRVIWQAQDELDLPGYGYVMTANVRDNCAGDIDGTGSVNVTDLLALLEAWGPCDPSIPCMADLDGSGEVAVDDVLKVMEQWGPCAAYVPPGFIEDCNGNLVPKGFLGDGILDQGQRQILFDPVMDPNSITDVDLNCPELNWDSLEGNPFVISPDDPRLGACSFDDGNCEQLTLSQCEDDGKFWGAGVSCDSVQGIYSIEDPLCEQSDSQSYGLPMPDPSDFESSLVLAGNVTYRQVLSPGIYSISRLAWVQARPDVMAMTKPNLDEDDATPLELALSDEISFGITIYYMDGGAPDFIRRVPTLNPVAEYSDVICSYVIEDLLQQGEREVHSIRIAVDPDGLQTDSSRYFNSKMWSLPIADGEALPIAERTMDGGRTWSPVLNTESENVQLTICVTP